MARLARSLAIFSIDEVIVYNDAPTSTSSASSGVLTNLDDRRQQTQNGLATSSYTADSDPCHFLAQVLSFLECPPFMRRFLFPLHPNLKHTALLPQVDMPHHPSPKDPWIPYREGVTVPPDHKDADKHANPDAGVAAGALVDTGLDEPPVQVNEPIPPNTRVTLHYASPDAEKPSCVHPDTPRQQGGYYWGYGVRQAASLSGVFTECPYDGGYDVSIGTSERGTPVSQASLPYDHGAGPSFRHLLVVFGGPRGVEYAAGNDTGLAGMGIRGAKTRELFDYYVNVLPNQGSRTIFTEEAIPIAMMALRGLVGDV